MLPRVRSVLEPGGFCRRHGQSTVPTQALPTMTISSSTSTNFSGRSLLVENFQLSARASSQSEPEARPRRVDTTPDRIHSMVAGISGKLLDAARLGSAFTSFQGGIDTALSEISELLSQSLTLGGSQNSVVRGLDSSRINDLEIRTLPPNGSARPSGGIAQQAGNAKPVIADAGRLQDGETLDLNTGGSDRRIEFQPGRSSSGIAQPINSKNIGAKASQIDRVDLSRLPEGVSRAVQGQVDSVTSVARLTFQGGPSGLATGPASIDASGDLGTANVETRGESLFSFAEKINNVSAFTGVKAEVNGNELRLVSQLGGDDAEVRLSNVVRQFRPTIEGSNGRTGDTGVVATLSESRLTLESQGDGSDGIVGVDVVSGSFYTNGGDGNGNASGQDGHATLHGETYNSSTEPFEVSIGDNSMDLEFVDGFRGRQDAFEIDPEVTVQRRAGNPSTHRSSATESDRGSHVTALTGAISTGTTLTGPTLSATQTALVDLFQLASGGKYDSQNADALDAYNVTKEALANLQSMFGGSNKPERSLNGLLFDQTA